MNIAQKQNNAAYRTPFAILGPTITKDELLGNLFKM
jgi:hypothetical protein